MRFEEPPRGTGVMHSRFRLLGGVRGIFQNVSYGWNTFLLYPWQFLFRNMIPINYLVPFPRLTWNSSATWIKLFD